MGQLSFLFITILICIKVTTFAADDCYATLDKVNNLMVELLKTPPASSENKAEHEVIMGCLFKNRGLLDEDGDLIEDNFIHAIVKELRQKHFADVAEKKANEALAYCKKAKGATVGQTSLELIKCLGIWKNQAFIDNERKEA